MNQKNLKNEIIEAFMKFFSDCENFIRKIKIPKKYIKKRLFYKYFENETLNRKEYDYDFKKFIDWYVFMNDEEMIDMIKIDSIEKCVNSLVKVKKIIDYGKNRYSTINNKSKLEAIIKSDLKHELILMFCYFKEYQEKFGINAEKYIQMKVDDLFSRTIFSKFCCRLINFNSQVEKIEIGNFIIRKPTIEEINDLMNNNKSFNSGIKAENIALAPWDENFSNFWLFFENNYQYKLIGRTNFLFDPKYVGIGVNCIKDLQDFIEELFLSLRLADINTGIRNYFFEEAFSVDHLKYKPWISYRYKYEDFGKNINVLGHGHNRKIEEKDVRQIKKIEILLNKYKKNPIEQISKALEHYSKTFDYNHDVNMFTELMIAFESLLSDKVEINKDIKKHEKELIKSIIELAPTIQNRNNFSKTKAKEVLGKIKYKYSLERMSKLLAFLIGSKDREEIKNALKAIMQSRNDLLHGNLEFNNDGMRKNIPILMKYLRLSLLKIIQLRNQGKLQCEKDNYYDFIYSLIQ